MKNKKNEFIKNDEKPSNKKIIRGLSQQKTNNNQSNNKTNNSLHLFWKVVAIAVIVLFGLFIIGGLKRAHDIRSEFITPTKEQVDSAKQIAAIMFESKGNILSDFQIRVNEKIRKPHDVNKNDEKMILQVAVYNNTITHIYLVDVNSGKVVMHSETEFYEPMPDIHRPAPPGDNLGFFVRGPFWWDNKPHNESPR